jgi:hypothetical protein
MYDDIPVFSRFLFLFLSLSRFPSFPSIFRFSDVACFQLDFSRESQIAQHNQIRAQQAAAAGILGGYLNGPMFYPPGAGFPLKVVA